MDTNILKPVDITKSLKHFVNAGYDQIALVNYLFRGKYNFSLYQSKGKFKHVFVLEHLARKYTAFESTSPGFDFVVVGKAKTGQRFRFSSVLLLMSAFSTSSLLGVTITGLIVCALIRKLKTSMSPMYWMCLC